MNVNTRSALQLLLLMLLAAGYAVTRITAANNNIRGANAIDLRDPMDKLFDEGKAKALTALTDADWGALVSPDNVNTLLRTVYEPQTEVAGQKKDKKLKIAGLNGMNMQMTLSPTERRLSQTEVLQKLNVIIENLNATPAAKQQLRAIITKPPVPKSNRSLRNSSPRQLQEYELPTVENPYWDYVEVQGPFKFIRSMAVNMRPFTESGAYKFCNKGDPGNILIIPDINEFTHFYARSIKWARLLIDVTNGSNLDLYSFMTEVGTPHDGRFYQFFLYSENEAIINLYSADGKLISTSSLPIDQSALDNAGNIKVMLDPLVDIRYQNWQQSDKSINRAVRTEVPSPQTPVPSRSPTAMTNFPPPFPFPNPPSNAPSNAPTSLAPTVSPTFNSSDNALGDDRLGVNLADILLTVITLIGVTVAVIIRRRRQTNTTAANTNAAQLGDLEMAPTARPAAATGQVSAPSSARLNQTRIEREIDRLDMRAMLGIDSTETVLVDLEGIVPKHFLSSVTEELMLDPVFNSAGRTYDRKDMLNWFSQGQHTDPITRDQITDGLTPNVLLVNEIIEALPGIKEALAKRDAESNTISTSTRSPTPINNEEAAEADVQPQVAEAASVPPTAKPPVVNRFMQSVAEQKQLMRAKVAEERRKRQAEVAQSIKKKPPENPPSNP